MGSSRPSSRTFVVQYNAEADPDGGRLSGRVEHVRSGRRERFASQQEMLEFVAGVLGEENETPEQEREGR
jgi:hypothetical protein